jgi:hypothetical protein
MNINDLPPAAKLAALIEAGRAANPDLKHGRGAAYSADRSEACALGFAAFGAGVSREGAAWTTLDRIMPELTRALAYKVIAANDEGVMTLDQIIHSLREGELAKVSA